MWTSNKHCGVLEDLFLFYGRFDAGNHFYDKAVYQACGMAGEFLGKAQHGQNRKRAESCMLRGGLTEVTAPKPVGFPVSEARLVGVGSIRPVDGTNPRTLSVEFTVSYCV